MCNGIPDFWTIFLANKIFLIKKDDDDKNSQAVLMDTVSKLVCSGGTSSQFPQNRVFDHYIVHK
jgi:hypothetical protein